MSDIQPEYACMESEFVARLKEGTAYSYLDTAGRLSHRIMIGGDVLEGAPMDVFVLKDSSWPGHFGSWQVQPVMPMPYLPSPEDLPDL